MTAVARPAAATDLEAVLRLQRACHDSALLESAACLASVIARGSSFVAVAGGEAVGYLLMHEGREAQLDGVLQPLHSDSDESRCLFLHDVCVAPAVRGTGVAHLLVNAALQNAAERASKELHLVALPGTAALWRRYGFEDSTGFSDAASYGAGATHMARRLG
jgi:GNAT superfamily N-acetyltransferase